MRIASTVKISALLAMALLAGCNNANNSQDADLAEKTVRFATEGAYPPFNTLNADGTLSGFDVDVANAICQKMQAKCQIVSQDWDGIIPALLSQKYDAVVAGMSITDERAQVVDFSQPYFANTVVWLAKPTFDSKNINNQTLAGQRATTGGQYLQTNFDGKNGNKVNLYDSYENAYLELKSGRAAAVLAEKVSASDFLKNNPDFAMVGDEIDNKDNIAIAVRKGDVLKGEIDKALGELKASGELDALVEKNFGANKATDAKASATDAKP